jgi:hypothetical protein
MGWLELRLLDGWNLLSKNTWPFQARLSLRQTLLGRHSMSSQWHPMRQTSHVQLPCYLLPTSYHASHFTLPLYFQEALSRILSTYRDVYVDVDAIRPLLWYPMFPKHPPIIPFN